MQRRFGTYSHVLMGQLSLHNFSHFIFSEYRSKELKRAYSTKCYPISISFYKENKSKKEEKKLPDL